MKLAKKILFPSFIILSLLIVLGYFFSTIPYNQIGGYALGSNHIVIETDFSRSTAEYISKNYTKPLIDKISQDVDLGDIRSIVSKESSYIYIENNSSSSQLLNNVNLVVESFHREVGQLFSDESVNIYYEKDNKEIELTILSDLSDRDTYFVVEDIISEIKHIDAVGNAYLQSDISQDIIIEYDLEKLSENKLDIVSVNELIRNSFSQTIVGESNVSGTQRSIIIDRAINDFSEVASIQLLENLTIGDLAEINYLVNDNRSINRVGKQVEGSLEVFDAWSIILEISDDADILEVSDAIRYINNQTSQYDNISVNINSDILQFFSNKLPSLISYLFLSIILAAIVITFLSSLNRGIFISIHSIISISITLLVVILMGIEINQLSILTLFISLPFVIDMALRVIKYIDVEMAKDSKIDSIDMINGISNLVFPEGLILIGFFLVIGFANIPLPLNLSLIAIVSITFLIASFVVSLLFSFTTLSNNPFFRLYEKEEINSVSSDNYIYSKFIDRDVFAYLTVIITVLAFSVSIITFHRVIDLDFLPSITNNSNIRFDINVLELDEKEKIQLVSEIEDNIIQYIDSDITSFSIKEYLPNYIGLNIQSTFNLDTQEVLLVLDNLDQDINYNLIEKYGGYASNPNQLSISILGEISTDIRDVATSIVLGLRDRQEVDRIEFYENAINESVVIVKPDIESMNNNGVSKGVLDRSLDYLNNEIKVADIPDSEIDSSVLSRVKLYPNISENAINNLVLLNTTGESVRLGDIARLEVINQNSLSKTKNGSPYGEVKLTFRDNSMDIGLLRELESNIQNAYEDSRAISIDFGSDSLKLYNYLEDNLLNNLVVVSLLLVIFLSMFFSSVYPAILSILSSGLVVSIVINLMSLVNYRLDILSLLSILVILIFSFNLSIRVMKKSQEFRESIDQSNGSLYRSTLMSFDYLLHEVIVVSIASISIALLLSIFNQVFIGIFITFLFGFLSSTVVMILIPSIYFVGYKLRLER